MIGDYTKVDHSIYIYQSAGILVFICICKEHGTHCMLQFVLYLSHDILTK